MDQYDGSVTLVVVESDRCQMSQTMDVDTALTVIALISDDPDDWEQATGVWPRYRTPLLCEFASGLPIEEIDRREVPKLLAAAEAWVVIDFPNKRIFIGGCFMTVGRDADFAMFVDEKGAQHYPMSVHLPPWWELHEKASLDSPDQPRQSTIKKPYVNREILYGDALLEDIASRALKIVATDSWQASESSGATQPRYPFTVSVHREWLMTPRKDLDGCMPRQSLHGATEWSERVTWGQKLRIQDDGPAIAAPSDWPSFATAPMGHEEVCIYFDLCRELIDAAWYWCESETGRLARKHEDDAFSELVEFLRATKNDWLNNAFEGGSPPSFIIQCDRRRVPRAAGVAIAGIDEVQADQHVTDCDCPICEMMADGIFGVGFTSIDGHHLELDEEFAFSLAETYEDWLIKQQEFAEFSDKMDRLQAERESHEPTAAPFESAWTGMHDDGPLPGDSDGNLKLAFMIAEIISTLEAEETSLEDIRTLNECFRNYRLSDDDQRPQSASALKANLQEIASRYPNLISKSADLQSRIDEAERNRRLRKSSSD
jgi:hypothetical protein